MMNFISSPNRTVILELIFGTLSILTCLSLFLWHVSFPILLHTRSGNKPNILLIVADDVGFNDVGYARDRAYRDERVSPAPVTPNLDRLASEGVKFEENYALPTCTPSRAALHTGKYPHRIGVQGIIEMNEAYGIPLKEKFLPEYLREFGYDCHMIGKWHLGYCNWAYTPTKRGYQSFLGYHGGAEYYFTHNNIVDFRGKKMNGYDFWRDQQVYRSKTYSTFEFSNRTMEIIENSVKTDKPFFINLSFQAAHAPLEVPDVYLDVYKNVSVPLDRKRFMAIMTAMDEEIGRIVDKLREKDVWKDTVLIFTSDNGGKPSRGGSNYPLRGTKTTLWEGGTRVPGFIVGKGVPKGTIYKGFFHIVDWLPTILGFIGAEATETNNLDGLDHSHSISNSLGSPRNEFVYQINPGTRKMAIRVGDWKLLIGNPGTHNFWYSKPTEVESTKIWTKNPDEMHLYNIFKDPFETKNLTLRHPEIAARLRSRLMKHKKGVVDVSEAEKTLRADPGKTGGVWTPGWCSK